MKANVPSYCGYRFPPEIISHAVWLYRRFCLSFRDVEDLLAKRGIIVSYETIRPNAVERDYPFSMRSRISAWLMESSPSRSRVSPSA